MFKRNKVPYILQYKELWTIIFTETQVWDNKRVLNNKRLIINGDIYFVKLKSVGLFSVSLQWNFH